MTEATYVRLRPGDVVIFKCDTVLSQDAQKKAALILESAFPNNESLVLERGQSIDVVRPAKPWWRIWK